MLETINAWLEHPDDYAAGLSLLRKTGYSGFTLSVLEKGENAYNRQRLEAELRKWMAATPKNVLPSMPARALPAEQSTVVASKPTTGIDTEPPAVVDLRQRMYALLDERVELKAGLRVKAGDGNSDALMAERLPSAIRIKQITRQLDEIDSQLGFFAEHGYLPAAAADPAVEVDDTKALMNARTYVSRYKSKLRSKKLTPEQRQSWEVLLTQYAQEVNRLETKLGKPNDSHSTGQQTSDRPIHPDPLSGA